MSPKKAKTKPRSRSKRSKTTKPAFKLRSFLFNKVSLSILVVGLVFFSIYIIYLNNLIIDKMSGRVWSLPSQVYARPLDLYKGKPLSTDELLNELTLLSYRRVNHRPTKAGQFRILNNVHFEIISRDFNFWDGPQKSLGFRLNIVNQQINTIHELYSDKTIPLIKLDPVRVAGIYPGIKQDRQLIKLDQVPDILVLSLLSVEDKRFYQHAGVDPRSILRALMANIFAGKTVQGGSTLTQQLIKNLFLTPERSLLRKLNEALMALIIEVQYDKSIILEAYINEVYLGQDGANQIHGFELASQFYFNQSLNKIRRDQAALLVGMVKGPSLYDPRRHPERAKKRRNQVLQLMQEQQVISTAQLNKYKVMSLGVVDKAGSSKNRFPALVDLVKRQLKQDYNDDDLKSSGLKIFTSIDPLVQLKAENSVKKWLPRLQQKNQETKLQTSVIIASSQQGEIEAMVSDRQPSYPGFNRSLDAKRQIGSLIKPAIYLAALQQPERYTLASLLADTPLHIKTSNSDIWSPLNYDKKFLGEIPLYLALEKSRNIPSVRTGLDIGLANITDTLHNLGVKGDIPAYPSITLGAFDLSPFQVASMYQTFAAEGFHTPLKVIREVVDEHGQPLKRYPLNPQKTLDEKAVYLINNVLHRVTQTGTAKSVKPQLSESVAGKTGTTDDLRDSWFAGYSDNKLAVVWMGHDDNSSTGLSGSTGALKLWTDIMKSLHIDGLVLQEPEGIDYYWIDKDSGKLSGKNCQSALKLPFIKGSQPVEKADCKSIGLFQQIKQFFNE